MREAGVGEGEECRLGSRLKEDHRDHSQISSQAKDQSHSWAFNRKIHQKSICPKCKLGYVL